MSALRDRKPFAAENAGLIGAYRESVAVWWAATWIPLASLGCCRLGDIGCRTAGDERDRRRADDRARDDSPACAEGPPAKACGFDPVIGQGSRAYRTVARRARQRENHRSCVERAYCRERVDTIRSDARRADHSEESPGARTPLTHLETSDSTRVGLSL